MVGGMGKYSCPCGSRKTRVSEYTYPCHPSFRVARVSGDLRAASMDFFVHFRLVFGFAAAEHSADGDFAGAGAEQGGGDAAIEGGGFHGSEALVEVDLADGHGHVAEDEEGGGAGEEADGDENSAGQLGDDGGPGPGVRRG